jgi:hypothetical protein
MKGEGKPFCPFILRITVIPESVIYEDAVSLGDVVKNILTDAGLRIEVAFVESVVSRERDSLYRHGCHLDLCPRCSSSSCLQEHRDDAHQD